MKKRILTSLKILCVAVLLIGKPSAFAQRYLELNLQQAFVHHTNLGRISSPTMLEYGVGTRGGGGYKANFGMSIGLLVCKYQNVFDHPLLYKSLLLGGNMGFRPLAGVWFSRVQPIVQLNAKWGFHLKGDEEEQTVTDSTLYQQANVGFISLGIGAEYFLNNDWAVSFLISRDSFKFNSERQGSISAVLKVRRYVHF